MQRGFLTLSYGTLYFYNYDLVLDQSVETQISLGIEFLNNSHLANIFAWYTALFNDMCTA